MDTPYLVQRGQFKAVQQKDLITGIDSILSFDYMGSTEFEFGALHAALRAILPKLDEYEIRVCKLGSHKIWAIAKTSDIVEVTETFLPGVYRSEYRLKEAAQLDESLNDPKGHYARQFWWDISNHWMATVTKAQAKNVLTALGKVRERWIKEGKMSA